MITIVGKIKCDTIGCEKEHPIEFAFTTDDRNIPDIEVIDYPEGWQNLTDRRGSRYNFCPEHSKNK